MRFCPLGLGRPVGFPLLAAGGLNFSLRPLPLSGSFSHDPITKSLCFHDSSNQRSTLSIYLARFFGFYRNCGGAIWIGRVGGIVFKREVKFLIKSMVLGSRRVAPTLFPGHSPVPLFCRPLHLASYLSVIACSTLMLWVGASSGFLSSPDVLLMWGSACWMAPVTSGLIQFLSCVVILPCWVFDLCFWCYVRKDVALFGL